MTVDQVLLRSLKGTRITYTTLIRQNSGSNTKIYQRIWKVYTEQQLL
jgi:hypothetical protein